LTPGHIQAWQHQYEFRPGRWAPTDYVFALPGERGRVLHLSKPGSWPSRVRLGTLACNATDLDRALFVDDGAGGCFIRGWPPCRCERCIVLPHGIGALLTAVDSDGTLTIVDAVTP